MELTTIKNNGRWDALSSDLNQNFSKIDTEFEKQKYATTRLKGLFATADKLVATVSHPQEGDWAVIGKTIPGPIWTYSNGNWAATGDIGGGAEVIVPEVSSQYGDSTEKAISQQFFTQEVMNNRHIYLSQDAYNALVAAGAEEEGMIYMTYEEDE